VKRSNPPSSMKISASKVIGVVVVAAAFAFLFTRPDTHDDVLGPIVFIALMLVGVMLILGYIGLPAGYLARKRALRLELSQKSEKPGSAAERGARAAEVIPRVYKYPSPLIARIALWGFSVLMLAMGVGMVALEAPTSGFKTAILIASMPLLAVPFFAWFAYRIPRIRFDIGPQGLNVCRLIGSVRIPWQEIVMLKRIDPPEITAGILVRTTVFRIHSLSGNAEFQNTLTGAKELAETIQRITGLDWE
jgi:hypothetical protein